MAAEAREQAVGAQCGQAAKNAAEHEVGGWLEAGGGALGQSEGGGGALVGAGTSGADGSGGLSIGAAALGFGGLVGGGRRGGLAGGAGFCDSSCGDGLAQGGVFDARKSGGRGDGVALVEQELALRGCFDGEHDRAAHGPELVEGCGSLGVELFTPAHQRARGGAQGLLDLAGARMAVGHQGGQSQALTGAVPGGVGKVVVGSEKPGHLPVLGKATHDGIDSNCPIGHSGQE